MLKSGRSQPPDISPPPPLVSQSDASQTILPSSHITSGPVPAHTPQSSTMASPPQTPAQSISVIQLPSQSKFSSENSQSPS